MKKSAVVGGAGHKKKRRGQQGERRGKNEQPRGGNEGDACRRQKTKTKSSSKQGQLKGVNFV